MSVERQTRPADEGGASALEFALIAPVFFAIVFGLMELGWAQHCGSSVKWALETSARTLLLSPSTTQAQLQSAVVAKLSGIADASNVSVTLSKDTSTTGVVLARASATYTQTLSIPVLGSFPLTFKSTTAVPVG